MAGRKAGEKAGLTPAAREGPSSDEATERGNTFHSDEHAASAPAPRIAGGSSRRDRGIAWDCRPPQNAGGGSPGTVTSISCGRELRLEEAILTFITYMRDGIAHKTCL